MQLWEKSEFCEKGRRICLTFERFTINYSVFCQILSLYSAHPLLQQNYTGVKTTCLWIGLHDTIHNVQPALLVKFDKKTCPICPLVTLSQYPDKDKRENFTFIICHQAGGREEGKYFLTSQWRKLEKL